jgi:hypothetical protein
VWDTHLIAINIDGSIQTCELNLTINLWE